MRGLIDNSVNLGGAQTITGQKKFMQTKIDVDNIPTDTIWGEGLTFVDKNGVRIGKIEPQFRANGYIELVASSEINGEKTSISSRAKADGTKNVYISGNSSDNNTALTTAAHTFNTGNTSSACKLGNGVILNWGRVNSGFSSNNVTITFAMPFSSADSYACSPVSTLSAATNQGHGYVNNATATNIRFQTNNDMLPVHFVAVGV